MPADLVAAWKPHPTSPEVRAAKNASDTPQPVAVTVTDGTSPRAVVIGNGAWSPTTGPAPRRPAGFNLVAASIDWLRERPAVGVTTKAVRRLPVQPGGRQHPGCWCSRSGWAVLTILGLGIGVWVIRRQ